METLTLADVQQFYTNDDLVHDLAHIGRVHRQSIQIATQEGANVSIVAAAALLHDAEDIDNQYPFAGENKRVTHHEASAFLAGLFLTERGWDVEDIAAVQACIRAHRFRMGDAPKSLEAKCLFDADKLDAIGAIGVARSIAYATQKKTQWYATPSEQFLMTNMLMEGEIHSSYHEFVFKLRNIRRRLQTATGLQLAEQRHATMAHFFQQLQAEYTGEASNQIQRTNTVIYCDKWESAKHFYEVVLQLPIAMETEWFAEFSLGNQAYVSLIDTAHTQHASSNGVGMLLTWRVANLQDWHQTLESRGVAVGEILTVFDRPLFRFTDPEGTRIEIWQ